MYFKHYSGRLFVDPVRTSGDGTLAAPAPTPLALEAESGVSTRIGP